MNDADIKGFEARIADLEARMDNVVDAGMLLTKAIHLTNNTVDGIAKRTDLLVQGYEALADGLKIISGMFTNRS